MRNADRNNKLHFAINFGMWKKNMLIGCHSSMSPFTDSIDIGIVNKPDQDENRCAEDSVRNEISNL